MGCAHNNHANAYKEIKPGISAVTTMDSFRLASVDGNAYAVSFGDTTGIVSGVSYYYWVKNTSTTKDVWLRPMYFTSGQGTLQTKIIKGGTFAVGGVTYDPENYHDIAITGTITSGSPYITGVSPTTYLVTGMAITGTGIPARSYIAVSGTTVTITDGSSPVNATADGTAAVCSLPEMLSRNLSSYYADTPALRVWYQNTLGAITYTSSAINQLYETIDYQQRIPIQSAPTMNIISPGDYFMAVLTNYGTMKTDYCIGIEWSEV